MEKNKYGLIEAERERYREILFEKVREFENKHVTLSKLRPKKYKPVSKAALYNYALSLLNIEFYKLEEEDRQIILKEYEGDQIEP